MPTDRGILVPPPLVKPNPPVAPPLGMLEGRPSAPRCRQVNSALQTSVGAPEPLNSTHSYDTLFPTAAYPQCALKEEGGPMSDYEAPMVTELGSLDELTEECQTYKTGSGFDVVHYSGGSISLPGGTVNVSC